MSNNNSSNSLNRLVGLVISLLSISWAYTIFFTDTDERVWGFIVMTVTGLLGFGLLFPTFGSFVLNFFKKISNVALIKQILLIFKNLAILISNIFGSFIKIILGICFIGLVFLLITNIGPLWLIVILLFFILLLLAGN